MSDPTAPPDSLPPVPAKIVVQTPPPPAQRVAIQPGLPRAAGATLVKTVFDAVPASTLTARDAAARARTNLQAAVRAMLAARLSVTELAKLTAADAAAANIAAHEGVGDKLTAQYLKLTEPLVAAFAPDA